MFSHMAEENARVRINSSMSNFVIARNGGNTNYQNFQKCNPKLYSKGTHLSDCAQSLFLDGIYSGLYENLDILRIVL